MAKATIASTAIATRIQETATKQEIKNNKIHPNSLITDSISEFLLITIISFTTMVMCTLYIIDRVINSKNYVSFLNSSHHKNHRSISIITLSSWTSLLPR